MFWYDRHWVASITKTFVATSIAILEDRDLIDSSRPIDYYLEELKDTEWQGTSIRNLLDMATGMDTEDVFADGYNMFEFFKSFGAFDTHLKPGSNNPINFLKSIKRIESQGTNFTYSSINTELLSWLVERVTEEKISKFIEREIYSKTGAEFEAQVITTMNGDCLMAGGMSLTLRDLAKYGMKFLPSKSNQENKFISDRYLNEIQSNLNKKLKTKSWFSEEMKFNSYQWDEVYLDGDFYKHGNNGQGLYISTSKKVVIAFFGSKNKENKENQLPFISRQIINSELFSN